MPFLIGKAVGSLRAGLSDLSPVARFDRLAGSVFIGEVMLRDSNSVGKRRGPKQTSLSFGGEGPRVGEIPKDQIPTSKAGSKVRGGYSAN